MTVAAASDKRAGSFATRVLLPGGQWLIAIGAVAVSIGLSINAKVAADKETRGGERI